MAKSGFHYIWNDSVSVSFNNMLIPVVESVTKNKVKSGLPLLLWYGDNSRLDIHIDRAPFEIAVSLCVDHNGDVGWPLSLIGNCGTTDVALKAGEALIFYGMCHPHYRETLPPHHSITSLSFTYQLDKS